MAAHSIPNTFQLAHTANAVLDISEPDSFIAQTPDLSCSYVVGEGSNILPIDDYRGVLIRWSNKPISICESAEAFHVSVGAGWGWHALVEHLLRLRIYGLENLALIPGTVGAAPVQNIGAYGAEFAQYCEWVDAIDLDSGRSQRFSADACEFGYRDSIFKRRDGRRWAIFRVGLILPKAWQPNLSYQPIAVALDSAAITAEQIFDAICQIRMTKLPDPATIGNAGSFFKNPVLSAAAFNAFCQRFPGAPVYKLADGCGKVAAGWLIDQSGLKGQRIGGAAVHMQQALVLTNVGGATAEDVLRLASAVVERVAQQFELVLEPEVRFLSAQGEINFAQARAQFNV